VAEDLGIDLLHGLGPGQSPDPEAPYVDTSGLPFADEVGNLLTNADFDAIMQDIGLGDYHSWLPPRPPPARAPSQARAMRPKGWRSSLSDEQVSRILQEYGWEEEDPIDPDGGGIETIENGNVVWVEAADTPFAHYSVITGELVQDSLYRLYMRTIYAPEGVGTENVLRGYINGKYRGVNVSDYWRPFPLVSRDTVALVGRKITSGRLEAIGKKLRDDRKGYVIGWILSLTRTDGTPKRRWLSMRDGEENCVVTLVRKELLRRCKTLTQAKEAILAEFQKRVAEPGADEEDLAWLCSKLKMRIEVRGLEGELLWGPTNSKGIATYTHCKNPITIYRGNGHAFADKPTMPPAKAVRVYTEDAPRQDGESFIAYEARVGKRTAEVISERGILRGFIVGSEIIDGEGTVHRPMALDIKLCELDGRVGDGPDYRMNKRGEEEEVLHVGGAQSLAFKLWRKQQGVESLPNVCAVRKAWRAANFEAVPWCRVDGVPEGSSSVDMRAAYLACDKRPERATGPGHEWAERFGFPKGEIQRRAKVSNLTEVEGLAGCVRFLEFVLADDCPEAIKAQLSYHFAKGTGPWLTIPMAIYLRDSGLLKSHRLEQVVYAVGRLDGIQFPSGALAKGVDGDFSERDLAVRIVGSCRYKSTRQTLWTRDPVEAQFYLDHYVGRDASLKPAGNGFILSYDTDQLRADHSYVRAYVLAYLFIGMAEAIRQIPAGCLAACKVDSLTLLPGVELPAGVPQGRPGAPKAEALYGMFLPKKATSQMPTTTIDMLNVFAPDPDASDKPLSEDSLYQYPLSFLDGQGGSGKTYRALRAFPGRKVTVLGKDNEHCLDLSSKEKNPEGHPARTYHEFFHIGANDPSTWDAVKLMGHLRPDVVIWDEIGCVPPPFLRATLGWLRKVNTVVVLCGDPSGQLQPIRHDEYGETVDDVIASLAPHVEFMGTDYRAKDCPRLQALKTKAWRADSTKQVAALRELPELTKEEFLQTWSPEDTVLVPTNQLGEGLEPLLEEVRAEKFPAEGVRFRFRPSKDNRIYYRKRKGLLPPVETPDGRLVPAVIGRREKIPMVPGQLIVYDKDLWIPDTWSTIYSMQGRTVPAPGRLIIVENRIDESWCRNGIYTAISRAEKIGQLYRVRL